MGIHHFEITSFYPLLQEVLFRRLPRQEFVGDVGSQWFPHPKDVYSDVHLPMVDMWLPTSFCQAGHKLVEIPKLGTWIHICVGKNVHVCCWVPNIIYIYIIYIIYYMSMLIYIIYVHLTLESRQRRTKGSVVGEEWCQNAAPLRWYTKNVFAQSKMILSRAWLHDTVSCAAWNDARKGVYLKPLFKTPCSNCYWGWSIPIMLDYRDISLMESVPLMWGPVTASPVGIEPMTIFGGGPPPL